MIRGEACREAARRIVKAIHPGAGDELVDLAASLIKIAAIRDERAQLDEIAAEEVEKVPAVNDLDGLKEKDMLA